MSLGMDSDDERIVPDKTALALAPSLAFLPGEGGQDIQPPGRAALLAVPPVVPDQLRVPAIPAISKNTPRLWGKRVVTMSRFFWARGSPIQL